MRGFSLLEVLVATTIVIVGVAALAQLVTLAAHANLRGKQTTIAAALAQEKLEELLPDRAFGQDSSPPGTLDSNVEGYCDFVDPAGRLLGAGPAAPAGSAYLRRWSVDPLPDSINHTSILQVLVADLRGRTLVRFVAAKAGRLP
jgi:type II secretory pathway pseudopilin PulG